MSVMKNMKKKFNMVRVVVLLMAVVMLLAGAQAALATSTNYFYTREYISNISGRAYAENSGPDNQTSMCVWDFGANAVSQSITWNVGDFTGFTVPNPKQNYQRGINNGWYGSTAVQMQGYTAGVEVHTWSAPVHSDRDLGNGQIFYKWTQGDNKRPWTHADSQLVMRYKLKVPTAYMEGGASGQVYGDYMFYDTVSGKFLSFNNIEFDTRGTPSFQEFVGWDGDTNAAYVYTSSGLAGAKYSTTGDNTASATQTPWSTWRDFEFRIDRHQFTRGIEKINDQYTQNLSTNPANYQLRLMSVQNEVYYPGTSNGRLGMAVKDIYVYEEYNFTQSGSWGGSSDKPTVGDFDSDGQIDDVARKNVSGSYWYYDYNHNGSTNESRSYGASGDLPVTGDFDRDGYCDDTAVFRPSNARWYIDYNHNGTCDEVVWYGANGDQPLAGDFDSDGKVDDIAVYRPSNCHWYIDYNHNASCDKTAWFGASGDLPIAGDFDGDGYRDDIAVFRPSNGYWYFDYDSNNSCDDAYGSWGQSGDLPFAGDFDNDGRFDDIGVYRPSTGMWYYQYRGGPLGDGPPVIPEPATIAMSAFALLGLAGIAKKKINSRRS